MLLAVALGGCTGDAELPEGEGTLRVGLWGDGASGTTYSLRDASFHVTGNAVDLTMFTAGLPDGTATISTPLAAGDYQIVLDPGWTVYRGDVGDPMPIPVDAELASDNPVPFTIADNLSTEVTFVFDVDGDLVPMNQGTLDVDVEFDEDDGVCMPTFLWEEIFVSTGEYLDQGDGWQSFTAVADAELRQVGLFWNVSFNDEFTINIYEGVGNSGTLLHSETFPGLGDSPPVDFDANVLATPVLLEEGQSYTIEGVDTFGWQTSVGSLPGSTSSLGDTRHKDIRLVATLCD